MLTRPSTYIASVALFFLIGGTAFAGSRYVITSTNQIKPSVLKKLHGANGVNGMQGPAGPKGSDGNPGSQGPAGTQGPAGAPGASELSPIFTEKGPENSFNEETEIATSIATCPAGSRVVSGGINTYGPLLNGEVSEANTEGTTWFVVVARNTPFAGGWAQAIAYCAEEGAAIESAAKPATSASNTAAQVATVVAKFKAAK